MYQGSEGDQGLLRKVGELLLGAEGPTLNK
jgi:hypothetical protein